MLEKKLVVGPFQCNCRLLVCPKTGEGVLVDPGDDGDQILKLVQDFRTPTGLEIKIKYLLHTHGHLDHIGATRMVHDSLLGIPKIAIHRDDEPLYLNLKMQGDLFGFSYQDPLAVEHYLEHEEILKVGDLRLSVIHTPGHSPGSVSIRVHEDSSIGAVETLLTGDTLFQGTVGRTDLWGADQDQMMKSIRERLMNLDGDTRVCPGHGADSTIHHEKKHNPFLC